MREILFRAKRHKKYCKAQNWTFGVPFIDHEGDCIFKTSSSEYVVDPETVGECSFVPDKNGVMMFEGDIVTGLFLFERSVNAVVTFQDGAFGLEWCRGNVKTFNAFTSICNVEYEVIGNIHDSPELLKGD